jgi:hypothetical protein
MTKSETLNTMKLLGIKEVTTPRQALNGTREFELPIKDNQVANGNYIPKWKYESYKDEYKNRVNEVNNPEVKVIVNGQKYNII